MTQKIAAYGLFVVASLFIIFPSILVAQERIVLYVHAVDVTETNGVNVIPVMQSDIERVLEVANESYIADANIEFRLAALTTLPNSNINRLSPGRDCSETIRQRIAANRRDSIAEANKARYRGKIVVFLTDFTYSENCMVVRNDNQGGFSWSDLPFIHMEVSRPERNLFGHEVGHYLGLAHTFFDDRRPENPAEANRMMLEYLLANVGDGDVRVDSAFDGDDLYDTPPDPGTKLFTSVLGLADTQDCATNLAGSYGLEAFLIFGFAPVTFRPDRENLMSYFCWRGISTLGDRGSLTREQRDLVWATLLKENRRALLDFRPATPLPDPPVDSFKTRFKAEEMLTSPLFQTIRSKYRELPADPVELRRKLRAMCKGGKKLPYSSGGIDTTSACAEKFARVVERVKDNQRNRISGSQCNPPANDAYKNRRRQGKDTDRPAKSPAR